MTVRPYRSEDRERLEQIYKSQGFEYEFPDIDGPTFFIKFVVEDESGNVVQAIMLHLTAEAYFLADPNAGTPRERFANFKALHEEVRKAAWYPGGLQDVHAWLPPSIVKSFGRRLMKLGWKRPLWASFARDLGD